MYPAAAANNHGRAGTCPYEEELMRSLGFLRARADLVVPNGRQPLWCRMAVGARRTRPRARVTRTLQRRELVEGQDLATGDLQDLGPCQPFRIER